MGPSWGNSAITRCAGGPLRASIDAMKAQVIALPGGVNPAQLRYAPVASALGGEFEFHLKDLEVYAGDGPPPG